MSDEKKIKEIVKEKYAEIAVKSDSKPCSCGCSTTEVNFTVISDDYSKIDGYIADADLGLGCGLPTEFAKIKQGDTVVDLGSGAGNDVFIARKISGENGKVIGIDFTQEMIDKANINARKLGFTNTEFILGDIENMPLPDSVADVVVSNCVLNLVPDKTAAFKEIYRILKKGGHFSISDVVTEGMLPPKIQKAAELYAGCISGALEKKDYLDIISSAGFSGIQVQREKEIHVPDEVILEYVSSEELAEIKSKGLKLLSINVFAVKN